ncbi:hypothetical protein A3F65_02215 [Candidatus Saccharibacteria bacterium RIFCSPHIGHO2_12_FULL_47_16b]|nr:MAG: hypothetical protein A3F65_02215 [Candidatus Saccharibacteria bacterium RIFCSPHIGHO2_12_FULL_47_16b]
MSKIEQLTASLSSDSRRQLTLEVRLVLYDGSQAVASVPQGKSTGQCEAVSLPPAKAVDAISRISNNLKASDFDQASLEQRLLELDGTANKSGLGANTTLGISMAFARASSLSQKLDLWQYLRNLYSGKIGSGRPRLYMNMINGGRHANNDLRFQEYLVTPIQDSLSSSLQAGKNFFEALSNHLTGAPIGDEGGFAPQFKSDLEPLQIYVDVAKTVEGDFEFGIDAAGSNIDNGPNRLYQTYQQMAKQFNISYLEDPFGEDDFQLFAKLKAQLGDKTLIVGDDLTTTNLERMRTAYERDSLSGIIIKPNQIGTVGESLAAIKQAREYGWAVIVSHRSGETMDDFIADLAWAVMADGAKFGAPLPKERLVKYERLVAIESAT